MAALFPKIYDTIDKNPHKHATLRWREPTSTEGSLSTHWEGFSCLPLQPPGPLSLLLLTKEPLYELSSASMRAQLLREHLLTLHERVDKELIGRRYPRRKIQDLLAEQISANTPSKSVVLEEALCELFQVQKVQLSRRTKAISFYPPDLRLWKSDRPLLFAEEDNTWSFTPLSQSSFAEWLLQKETEGWTIEWPTADGKYEELKTTLQSMHLLPETKSKKEDLARILGRHQSIRTLQELQLQLTPVKLETP
jgi:hypothetical protein